MLAPIQGKNARTYPVASHYPMSLGSRRGLRLLQTRSQKLGIEVASWHHHPNMKICKVCNENLVEDEYHLLLACSAIREKYDDLFDGHDNLSVMSRRMSTYVQDDVFIRSHRSNLASSWMIKMLSIPFSLFSLYFLILVICIEK